MLGLVGAENGFSDIQKAMNYFEKIPDDASSLNAIGVLYYQAPEYLEPDI
jgi:chaperonin cofactor prefoldin